MRSEAVSDALDEIVDPCSISAGRPMGLVTMGLVDEVHLGAEEVVVRLVLTDPGCPFFKHLTDAIHDKLEALGVHKDNRIEVVPALWTEERVGNPLRVVTDG